QFGFKNQGQCIRFVNTGKGLPTTTTSAATTTTSAVTTTTSAVTTTTSAATTTTGAVTTTTGAATTTTGAVTTTTGAATTTTGAVTTTTGAATTTTTQSAAGAFLEFTTGTPGGTCGNTQDGSAALIKNLTCGGLNIGGGSSIVPEGPTPDGSSSLFALSCTGSSCMIGP